MKIIKPTDTNSLHEILSRAGYAFPCGGKGLCGRCRIVAPTLSITQLDRRFLSSFERSNGIRLACDKHIEADTEMEILFDKSPPIRKLEYPQIIALLGEGYVELALYDDEILESLVFPLDNTDSASIRAVVGKNSIEYFERYNVPKAHTILVAGSHSLVESFTSQRLELEKGGVYPASLFDMPSEDVYLPPLPQTKSMGSSALFEVADLEDNELVILESDALIAYKGETVVCASIVNDYGEDINEGIYSINSKAFIASIRYFVRTFMPTRIKMVAKNTDIKMLNQMLSPYRIEVILKKNSSLLWGAKLLSSNRYKTQMDKLAKRVAEISLADEELWQDLFSN